MNEHHSLEIKRIQLSRVRIPLHEPFRISNGSVSEKEAIIIAVETGQGITGWGEASPMSGSFYSADTPESVWRALSEVIIPDVLNNNLIDATEFYLRLRESPCENCSPFAKAGIEGALWDAHAKKLNVPLAQLLGGSPRPVRSGVAIGIYDTIDELLERVRRYTSEGYQRVKIKVQPGWDVWPVKAVREEFPDVRLMVDANAAYTLNDINIFRELDRAGLMMIEQPLAREAHDDAAQLQSQLQTPICADESAESLTALAEIINKKSARIINIKVQRVGGLSEACLMLKQARAAGLEAWVGTMPELGIASAQGLHFAALDGFDYPTDIEASARWYDDDLIEPAITINKQGLINIAAGAGMGYTVSPEKLARYTIEQKEFILEQT